MKRYTADYVLGDDGWWTASVREVRGAQTQGRSIAQARRRVREALGLFVEDATGAELVDHIRIDADKDADVALIKLDAAAVRRKFVIKAFSKESFLPPDLPLSPGEDVFVMGYPLGVHDTVFSLPIFRSAMIASTYGVPFDGKPLFLTDANLHPGTSGSPVITKPKSAWVDDKGNTRLMTGTVYYLVGVHSAILSVTSGAPASKSISLGLGAAWYAELVEEIAQTFH